MSAPRCRCGSAVLGGNRWIVVGGHVGSTILPTVEMYNAETEQWSTLPPMKIRRDGCAAATVGQDLLLVFGGYDGNSYLSSVECFRFSTQKWSFLPHMHRRRWGCAATAIGNKVYVVGGNDGFSQSLSSGEVLNVDTGEWTLLPRPMKARREGCALVADTHNQRLLYALGGYGRNSYLDSCEVYNIATGQWNWMTNMSIGRSYCAAVIVSSKIMVIGGQGVDGCLSTTEVYNLETKRWKSVVLTAPMQTKRRGCTAALLPGHRQVLVAGGSSETTSMSSCLDTTEQLLLHDPTIPSPPTLPPLPTHIVQSSYHPQQQQQHRRRRLLVPLQRWIQEVQQLKDQYAHQVNEATLQYSRELRDTKAALEESLRRLDREHTHKMENMHGMAQPFFAKAEAQLREAQDEVKTMQQQQQQQFRPLHGYNGEEEEEEEESLALQGQIGLVPMVEPPPELLCPITLEVMKDPVVAADGHTYERFAIERALESAPRSPKTGELLTTCTLFPNVAIRTLCQEYQQCHDEEEKYAMPKDNAMDTGN